MFFPQVPGSPTSSILGFELFASIDAKTSARYRQIFWIQLTFTIIAYLYLTSSPKEFIFSLISVYWIQFVAIELAIAPLIVMHELGHAFAAVLLDVKVSKIVIGVGKTIGRFKIFNTIYEIAEFPIGGMVVPYQKSFDFYRIKYFAIGFAGPLTHILLSLLLSKISFDFKWYITSDIFVDIKSCLATANSSLLIGNLWPYSIREVDANGSESELWSDGLQLLRTPFMSDREIGDSIASIHLCEGWEYLQQKEYLQAIKSFHAALTIDPDLIRAYQGTALIHQYLLDYPEAIENFSKVVNLNISNASAYLDRGVCYLDWGKDIDREDESYLINYENALDDFNTAVTLDRTLVAAYYQRAAINFYFGNLDLSIANFSKIIELASSSNAYYNRAIIWWESDEYRSALTDFDRAIALDSNYVAAYYWRGNIYYELGDETSGSCDYELAQSIDDLTDFLAAEDEHGFYARGIARARLGDRVGAMVDFHQAADLCAIYKNKLTDRRIRSAIDRWNLV